MKEEEKSHGNIVHDVLNNAGASLVRDASFQTEGPSRF